PNADGGGGGGASTPGRDGDGDVAATNASPAAATGGTPGSPETTAEGPAAAAAVAAGAGAAAKPSGPEPSYNFGSDREAQERLDAVAMFEAGLEAPTPPPLSPGVAAAAAGGGLSASDARPDTAAATLVEVDPSLVLVMGTKDKLRRMDREERTGNGESPEAAAVKPGAAG
ncbi:unnamed protein product, partial [Ectocarpus sp. 12 AP-2014]